MDEFENIIYSLPHDSDTRRRLNEWRLNNLQLIAVSIRYHENSPKKYKNQIKQSAIQNLMNSAKINCVTQRKEDGTFITETFYIFTVKESKKEQ